MKMFDFKKRQQSPIQVTSERCITQTEFDVAVDELLVSWAKAMKAAKDTKDMAEVGRNIAGRICVLEQLNKALFGEESYQEEEKAC